MPFFIFILGLFVGSFLNVAILRLKANEQFTKGRSKCLNCQKELKVFDLVPVFSFIFLRGKCRYCRKKISWQYPLLELATGLIFLLGYFNFLAPSNLTGQLPFLLAYLIFSCFLIVIFVYDLKYYLILDKVSLTALIVALVINFIFGKSILNLLVAALVVAGFFLVQFVVSGGKWIGGGDIRLGLVMGAMLGWPNVLVALFMAYIIGALWGIGLIIIKKKSWGSQLPFGTFLSVATFITYLYGSQILDWYFNILF